MISWQELGLAEPKSVKFPNAISALIRAQKQDAPLEPRTRESALITIDGNGQVQIDDCVNTSANCEEPWILVVTGTPLDRVLLFGGEFMYVISSTGDVLKRVRTFRERRNEQFWRTKIIALDEESILIDYEVGAFVVESNLEIRWHVEKALIDFFDRREGASLIFLRDHEVPYSVDINSGAGVPVI